MKAKTKTNRKSNEKQKPQKKANGPARRSERNGKSNKGAPSKGPWRAPEAAVCAKCASSIQSQAWARACANRPKQGRNKTSIPPPGAVDAARSSPRRRNKEAGRSDPQPTGRGAEPAPAFGPPGAESVRKAHWVGLRRAGSRPARARFLPPTRGRLGLRSAVRKPGRSIGVFAPVGAGRFVGMGLGASVALRLRPKRRIRRRAALAGVRRVKTKSESARLRPIGAQGRRGRPVAAAGF